MNNASSSASGPERLDHVLSRYMDEVEAVQGDSSALRALRERYLANHADLRSGLRDHFENEDAVGASLHGRRETPDFGKFTEITYIGRGGMGRVYRAKDPRLGRQVALKVLPEEFTQDSGRVSRFEREAKLLASLNHPNIGAIYNQEESNGTQFLVLEFVEGKTLEDRLRHGALPVKESLQLALQIAEALEAAHENGVVHRDLKPGNIMVRPDGKVKVLDFGLATFTGDGVASTLSDGDDTASSQGTEPGVILRTAGYMSPEQARGRDTNRASDIWAFGCVLFEMLVGQPAFDGEDNSEILASVIKDTPDLGLLPEDLHPAVPRLLGRCLEKDTKRRFRDIGDVYFELSEVLPDPGGVLVKPPGEFLRAPPQSKLPWIIALVLTGILAGSGVWIFITPEPQPPIELTAVHSVPGIGGNDFDPDLVMSPDGTRFAYMLGADLPTPIYVRALDDPEATFLVEGRAPFFSPDGQWLGFVDRGGELTRVAITGGATLSISSLPEGNIRGAAWGPEDTIIFATSTPDSGLFQISLQGGEVEVLTTPDSENDEQDHLWPEFLPGGRAVLFTITNNQTIETSQIALLDLESGDYNILIQGGSNPRYSTSGHVVYASEGTLRAVTFDLASLVVTGTPVTVLEGVATKPSGAASFSVSPDGKLIYVAGDAVDVSQRTVVWVDREGREESIDLPPRAYAYAVLSPDGTAMALDVRDQDNDIWTWDFARETLTRLTFDPLINRVPLWSPDGERLAFSAVRNDGSENVYWQAANGSGVPEALTDVPDAAVVPFSFSPDGTELLFGETGFPRDIDIIRLDTDTGSEPLLFDPEFNETNAKISPDGGWVAHQSDESGRAEVYVRPFPDVNAGKWQISNDGGTRPVWNPDGSELFYYVTPGRVMAVPVETSSSFAFGTPGLAIGGEYLATTTGAVYSVSLDGQRFLMIKASRSEDSNASPPQINIVLNWHRELLERAPVD